MCHRGKPGGPIVLVFLSDSYRKNDSGRERDRRTPNSKVHRVHVHQKRNPSVGDQRGPPALDKKRNKKR